LSAFLLLLLLAQVFTFIILKKWGPA